MLKSPDEVILEFAQSTYDAASKLGKWDRAALEEKKPALHSARPTLVIRRDESWLRSRASMPGVRSKDGWRPLYGDVDKIGVAVEWHDFRTEHSFNWGRTFHPNSLEFCLNLDGHGAVGIGGRARSDYTPGNCGYYAIADEPLPASRRARDRHQFLTLEFSREHLQKQFVRNEADLEPEMRRIVFGDKEENVVAPAAPDDPATARRGR